MKFVNEYRDARTIKALADEISRTVTRPWTIMEVCGGQTHAILRFGIDQLLPAEITLVHGPGCPVCVTSSEIIDAALQIASREDVTFCSFGDMLRVPGTRGDLLSIRAAGGDVRTVYSPLDALKLAEDDRDRQVVFFAVGFETTAPATAMATYQASQRGIDNFSLLVAHVLVQPAMEEILRSGDNRVQGFLAAGHVCAVTGCNQYRTITDKHGVPVVVTGFEPVDILMGIHRCLTMLEDGRAEVDNQYARAVASEGNQGAQALINRVYRVCDREWRGMGVIPESGLALREEYESFDALSRFEICKEPSQMAGQCISGEILRGVKKPIDCSAFGLFCTPESPLGATMVSSEGACAAYYRYREGGRRRRSL